MKPVTTFIVKHFQPVFSFFANILYWIIHIFNLNKTLKEKKRIKKEIRTVDDVIKIVNSFKWRKETIDWFPWIITIINARMKDDCDGAAILGKWLLENIGIESEVLHLFKSNWIEGHAICVSKDKKIMISNQNFISINPNNWKFDVLKMFDFKYKYII